MARQLPESEFLQRMQSHTVYGVRELAGDPQDKASEILGYVHALITYMSALVAEGYRGPHLNRPIDTLNRQIVGGAFDALSYLAALADFYVVEIA